MRNVEYGLVEPFDCDELAFCLGVEWEMFRRRLAADKPFTDQIHTANAERLTKMCERHGRFAESISLGTIDGVNYDEWTRIIVGGLK